jgi:hypothetical protein
MDNAGPGWNLADHPELAHGAGRIAISMAERGRRYRLPMPPLQPLRFMTTWFY